MRERSRRGYVIHVRGRQIVEHWGVGDLLGLLQQPGILPALGLDTGKEKATRTERSQGDET